MFSYPDVLVVCGEPESHDGHKDVLINPKVIMEVLSESTEAFDRGEKFERYQTWNPSLSVRGGCTAVVLRNAGPVMGFSSIS